MMIGRIIDGKEIPEKEDKDILVNALKECGK
jgi:hypothetical protein